MGRAAQGVRLPDRGLLQEPLYQDLRHHAGHRPDRATRWCETFGGTRAFAGHRAGHRGVRRGGEGEVRDAAHRSDDLRGLVDVRDGGRAAAGVSAGRVAALADRRAAPDLAGAAADRGGQGAGHPRDARPGADAEEHARVPRAARALPRGLGAAPADGPATASSLSVRRLPGTRPGRSRPLRALRRSGALPGAPTGARSRSRGAVAWASTAARGVHPQRFVGGGGGVGLAVGQHLLHRACGACRRCRRL